MIISLKTFIYNSQNVVVVNTAETNTELVTKALVKGKIICALDMKLEIILFTVDLVTNRITKGISKLFTNF